MVLAAKELKDTVTATTIKTGRVTKLSDVKGVMAYRFVPKNWEGPPPPFDAHLCWYEFDPVKYVDDYTKIKADMIARAERLKNWCREDWDGTVSLFSFQGPWVVKVTYDEVERPVLVLIGGIA